MRNVSWKRIFFLVFIVVIIYWILAMQNINKLAQPTPHQINAPDPNVISIAISGKVLYPNGKPAPDAKVYLISPGGKGGMHIGKVMTTDSSGFYQLDGLTGYKQDSTHVYGSCYEIMAFTAGYGIGGLRSNDIPISDLTNCDISLHTNHEISGIVQDKYGTPIIDAQVNIPSMFIENSNHSTEWYTFNSPYHKKSNNSSKSEFPFIVFTDQNGKFHITGIPINKNIRVYVGKENYFGSGIEDGENGQVIKFVLDDLFWIEGTVINESNHKPFYWSKLALHGDNVNFSSERQVYVDGKFQCWGMHEGKYALYLDMPGFASETIHFELNRKNPSPFFTLSAHEIPQK